MDYTTKREIEQYKADKEQTDEILDAEKFTFKKKLMGSFGNKMMEELNNPPKRSIWEGIKNRYRRRKTISISRSSSRSRSKNKYKILYSIRRSPKRSKEW